MAILPQALADGVIAVARTIELHARQTATSAVSSAISSATTSAPTTSSTDGSPTSANPSDATTTSNSNNGSSGGGGTSSPLLFFVALGFGVVFTNLWLEGDES